jgi:hypothetical protein
MAEDDVVDCPQSDTYDFAEDTNCLDSGSDDAITDETSDDIVFC